MISIHFFVESSILLVMFRCKGLAAWVGQGLSVNVCVSGGLGGGVERTMAGPSTGDRFLGQMNDAPDLRAAPAGAQTGPQSWC